MSTGRLRDLACAALPSFAATGPMAQDILAASAKGKGNRGEST